MRQTIEKLISSLTPFDEKEASDITFVKEWIISGAPLWRIQKPDVPNIHLVSYFVPFDQEAKQVLLVDHKLAGLWLAPGGHVEPGEHPKETVLREAKEELLIDAELLVDLPLFVTVTQTVGKVFRHTDVSLWYLLKGNASKSLQYDKGEFEQIKWFSLNAIPYERTDPCMSRFIKRLEAYVDSTTAPI